MAINAEALEFEDAKQELLENSIDFGDSLLTIDQIPVNQVFRHNDEFFIAQNISLAPQNTSSSDFNTRLNLTLKTFYSCEKHGVGFKIWDASIPFGEWIIENREQFLGKKILEIGAGCGGIVGLCAAMFGDKTVVTDKHEDLIKNNEQNVLMNEPNISQFQQQLGIPTGLNDVEFKCLDWDSAKKQYAEITNGIKLFDFILGSEILYDGVDIESLIAVILLYLKNGGVVVFILPSFDRGIKVSRLIDILTEHHNFTYTFSNISNVDCEYGISKSEGGYVNCVEPSIEDEPFVLHRFQSTEIS